MSTRLEYSLTEVPRGEISQVDLVRELQSVSPGEVVETYRLQIFGRTTQPGAIPGEVVFLTERGRAGIAWAGEAIWTDASSVDEALERYLDHNILEDDPTSEGPNTRVV